MLTDFEIIMKSIRCMLILAGVFGNLFSFYIFSRSTFRKNSISTYGRALAVADMFILFDLAYEIHWLLYQTDLPSRSQLTCKLFQYFSISFTSIPGWILAAFSLDKLLMMRRRSSVNIITNKTFQILIVLFIYAFNLVANLELAILLDVKESSDAWIHPCFIPNIPYYNYFAVLIASNLSIIPVVIMSVSSVLIMKKLRSSRRRLENANSTTTVVRDSQRKSREVKFAISSLVFNFLYVTLRIPMLLSFLLAGYRIDVGIFVNEMAFLLFYGNSSITFLVHLVSNSIFRNELIAFVKHHANRIKPSGTISSSKMPSTVSEAPNVDGIY